MPNEVIQAEALQVRDVPQETFALQLRAPDAVLADAKRACAALMACIDAKPEADKVFINGELFLEQDDWALVSRFFQTTPKIRETRYVEFGDARGFEAYADMIDIRTGTVLCSADSMCLNDEENWGLRPSYDWVDDLDKDGKQQWVEKEIKGQKKKVPKRKKVEVESKPTPLFQLRSMAQTRAAAKVARLMYSWVVALSGRKISTTPAEEMRNVRGEYGPNIEHGDKGGGREPINQPGKAEPKAVPISEAQVKRMYAIGKNAGMSEESIKATYHFFGFDHADKITRDKYEAIIDAVKSGKVPTGQQTMETPKPAASKGGAFPIEGMVSDVTQENNKGPFIRLKMVGFELYSRDTKMFELLLTAKGQNCKFVMVQSGNDMKGKIVGILRIGKQEWLEDGTPCRQVKDDMEDDIPPEFEQ